MNSHSGRRADGPILPTTNDPYHRDSFPRRNNSGRKRGAVSNDPPSEKKLRGHFVAMSGEYVGTTMFLYFALSGTQVANTLYPASAAPSAQPLLYIALSFGFSLMVNVWVFYRISGGLFNPAVTLGLCISGGIPWARGLMLFPAQILGGITASALVLCMFPGDRAYGTLLGNGTSIAQGLFIEMFLTSLLVITVLMLAVEKSRATFIAPVGIGLALFVAELSGVLYTGGSLNPARSFGPAVAMKSFPGYHWIYWLGPALGAVIASGYYRFAKALNYEEANPGQDASTDREAEKQQRIHSSQSPRRGYAS